MQLSKNKAASSILPLLLHLPSAALANFHIFQAVQTVSSGVGEWENLWAITLLNDNNWSCYNAVTGSACDNEEQWYQGLWWMNFPDGICGSGPLDFYRADEWGGYHYYPSGGDGTEIGRCYPTSGTMTCVVGLGPSSASQLYWCDGLC